MGLDKVPLSRIHYYSCSYKFRQFVEVGGVCLYITVFHFPSGEILLTFILYTQLTYLSKISPFLKTVGRIGGGVVL